MVKRRTRLHHFSHRTPRKAAGSPQTHVHVVQRARHKGQAASKSRFPHHSSKARFLLNIKISYDSKPCGQYALEVEHSFTAEDVAMEVIVNPAIMNGMRQNGMEKGARLNVKTALLLSGANGKAFGKDMQIGRLLEEGKPDLVLDFPPPDVPPGDWRKIKPPPREPQEEEAKATLFFQPGGAMAYVDFNA